MEIQEIYHLLFETYAGIGILVGAGIVLSLIACIIFELRTRRIYKNHAPDPEHDDWSLFDDLLEGEEEEEAKAREQKAKQAQKPKKAGQVAKEVAAKTKKGGKE